MLIVLATIAVIWPRWPFFTAAWCAIKNGVLNMAVLVVLSVGTGYLFSVGATFLFPGVQFFEAVAVLLVFILLGHWLEMRVRALDTICSLMDLALPMATVLRAGRSPSRGLTCARPIGCSLGTVVERDCGKRRWVPKGRTPIRMANMGVAIIARP